ncbi:MAG: OsmC-related (seleno)protein [Candidatus Binatia bacterium]
MTRVPGSIDLGKFRLIYEEERGRAAEGEDSYLLQQRAIIRLNEELVKLERPQDCTVLCNEDKFRKEAGKRPSPLQYFIASVGFCMFSQFARFAARSAVRIDDAEMDLRMTYDLSGKLADFSRMAQGLSYIFKIKSSAAVEQVIRVVQLTDKGCHTVNSMRKRVAVSGKLLLNDRQFWVGD